MGITERREREKKQRRNDIINAAEHLFFKSGINNVTMEDVAKDAEYSKGTLYLYFKNKEDLHWAISQRAIELMRKYMEKAIDEKASGLTNLFNIGQAYIEFSRKEKNYFNVLMYFEGKDLSKLNIDKSQFTTDFHASPVDILLKIVKAGINDGSIISDLSVESLSIALWAQLMGILLIVNKKKEIFEIFDTSKEDILKNHFSIILNGIKSKD